MDSPHIKSSCGTQNKISNPMGIGLGIDYVTWENPKMENQIFMWDTKSILWV